MKMFKYNTVGAIIGGLLTWGLISCTKPVPPTKQEEKASYPVLEKWKPEWSPIVIDALETYGKELLAFSPKDKSEWCFGEDNKLNYLRLIQGMAKYESNFDPSTTYKETFHDRQGRNVISTGLLQMSAESCNGYGMTKKLTRYEELLDVHTNAECAVRVLNKWIPRDGFVAKDNLGAGRYWSVLRPGTKKDAIKKIMCGK